jgi:hypothetical protein
MNTRLSVSTIAYLAQQEMLAEEERFADQEKLRDAERKRQEERERYNIRNAMPYSEALAQEICERISCGELLLIICDDEHLPTMRRCKQWMNEHEDFHALYKDSLNDGLDIFEEQVIQIADDASRDFKVVARSGRTVRVLDGEAIARAKLRVEVRFRHLKAGRPNKWGDSTTLNVKSEDSLDASNLSDEALEKRLADMEIKDRIMKAA